MLTRGRQDSPPVTERRCAMRRLLAGFAMVLTLAGCGLPPALSVATTVADGFSYVTTGKGMTDHALSVVTESDCALLRAFDERDICTAYSGEEMPAILTSSGPVAGTWLNGGHALSVGASPRADTQIAAIAPPAAAAEALPESAPSRPDQVTVVGSFRDVANADRARSRLPGLQPRIAVSLDDRGWLYRVVSDVPLEQARAAGVADAWNMRIETQLAASL
jgi:hypothetical protein